jgi:hemolysin D
MMSAKSATPDKPARRVIPIRVAHERRGEELAFLPAALEIVETPPSPIGRAIAATIVVLFCAALAWAWWGTIDIVASATGKIMPSVRTKVVQPFETGVVRSIQVRDGQTVKAGDVLIELDPTVNAAERDHLRNDLLAEQLNIARVRAALVASDDPAADFTPPADAAPVLISAQRQLLLNQVIEHRAKVAALARQEAQKEAEQATTAATIHKLETTIPVIQQRVDIRKTLMNKELGSKPLISRCCSCWSSSNRNSGCRRATCARRRRPRPRSARPAARRWRNISARSPTISPRRRRRRTGSRRT